MLYKSLVFTNFPAYMKNMFSIRSSSYDLWGNYILSLRKPKTTNSGLNFFSYQTNSNENIVYVVLCYVTFQLSSGMHCLTFLHCLVFFFLLLLFFFLQILRLR